MGRGVLKERIGRHDFVLERSLGVFLGQRMHGESDSKGRIACGSLFVVRWMVGNELWSR